MSNPARIVRRIAGATLCLTVLVGCGGSRAPQPATPDSHERMLEVLREMRTTASMQDSFLGTERLNVERQSLRVTHGLTTAARFDLLQSVAELELRQGHNEAAIEHLLLASELAEQLTREDVQDTSRRLAVAYLRLGETNNCVHCRTGESCILPIRAGGIHQEREGSEKSIEYCKRVLQNDPDDATARWLLNIACMTLGTYPQDVPAQFPIGPDKFAGDPDFPRFENVAPASGVDTMSLLGGAAADDFDNDGLIDVLVSGWHTKDQLRFLKNRGDGKFQDRTDSAGLAGITGGGNLIQGDYDNDGDLDVLVLRGGWRSVGGRYPNSLLQNDGGGHFRDVTFDAGLGDEHLPSQTAAWADFDLDGDLDLYVGNERFPDQLFVNDGNGRFTNQASLAGVDNLRWTKGVVWGDFDGDRYPDIYVSNYTEENRLYHNNADGTFSDMARQLGVEEPLSSFPTWFWDFNNDGELDLYVPSYQFDISYVCEEYFDQPVDADHDRLYQGDGRGGFRDVSAEAGLRRVTQPMGANFGDLDNDGYLDFYLGTGYPEYEALMPNLMYRNLGGQSFADVTVSGGFGHLQKGHGVAFADFDNDGDQDVFVELGGAYPGDAFGNALFQNPGFGKHWIRIKLVGQQSNRCAIGARIRLDLNDAGTPRTVFRWVNSGGSFGANPLTQQLGLGDATTIATLEVFWPKTGKTQTFRDVNADQFIEIREDSTSYNARDLQQFLLRGSSK